MRLIIPKKSLLTLVQRCQGVADKKSAVPALSNILLTATAAALGSGSLAVAATDLYIAVSGSTAADVHEAGAVALPAHDLLERVRAMPDGPLEVSVIPGETQATIKAKRRTFVLSGLPADVFPPLPVPPEGAPALTLPVAALSDLISRAAYSISDDTTRAVNGGLVEWMGSAVQLVSTDGHRLTKASTTVNGASASAALLIPQKAIGELRRLAEEADDGASVTIVQGTPWAHFTVAGFCFSAKLLDAQAFPPYQQVIPASTANSCRVKRTAFAEALRAVSLAANDKSGGIKLALTAGEMVLSAETSEAGKASDHLDVDYTGADFVAGYNARYFLDALAAIDDEEVILGMTGALDPTTVRPATQGAASGYLAVVMPMRV